MGATTTNLDLLKSKEHFFDKEIITKLISRGAVGNLNTI